MPHLTPPPPPPAQGLVRVYTKKVGSKPDFGDPVVLRCVLLWCGGTEVCAAGLLTALRLPPRPAPPPPS